MRMHRHPRLLVLMLAGSILLLVPREDVTAEAVPSPDQSDAQSSEAESAPEVAPVPPQDLPDKLPSNTMPDGELFPGPLRSDGRLPGLDPIEEIRAKASREKKAEEEIAEEAAVDRRKAQGRETSEIARSSNAMNQALGTGDTILGGFSYVPGGLSSPFLPAMPSRAQPFQYGWGRLSAHAGAGIAAGRMSGTPTGETDEGVLGFVQGGLAISTGDPSMTSASGAFQAKPGRHMFASLAYDFRYGFPDPGEDEQSFGSGQSAGLNQRFSLATNFHAPGLRRLVFGMGFDFASVSGISRDFGADTDRYFATASFTASYELSRKTSLDFEMALPFRDFTDGINSRGVIGTISARTWLSPMLRTGLAYTLGKLTLEEGSNQSYQQATVLLNYSPTRFLHVNGTAGFELRDTGAGTDTTPVFGLGIGWNSLHGSTLSLSAERRIFNAASAADTNYTSTSIILSFSQKLWHRLSVSASLGYERAIYQNTETGEEANQREDDLFTFTLGLTIPITDQLGCSLEYTYGRNESEVSPFRSSQATFQASYAF